MSKYTLNSRGEPVHEPDLVRWTQWLVTANRFVSIDVVGDAKVSTIFLGMDYNFFDGPPILWQSRVSGGSLDCTTDRCAGSREQAEAMHAAMISRVRQALNSPKKQGS